VSAEHEVPLGDQVDQRDLPLWAQRQNRIRRQSLLPRPELDFVSGSGILPPDNKDLSTRGGATIISYPVLLSDVMQVRIDEIEAKLAADRALYQQVTEENESVEAGNSPSSATADHSVSGGASHRRKKGMTKKVGGSLAFEDADLFSDSEQRAGRRLNKRRQSRASITPEAQEPSVNPVRVVPERHGASIYRRGERHHHHYHNGRPSSSPSASPSPPARRARQNMLGSPVKLGGGSNAGQFDDDDDVLDYENDESIMDHDGDDYDDSYKAHKNRHQSGDRSSHSRHVLAIPPGEVDIAMQLTRDMMSRRRQQSSMNDHDSHLRSLQPLLDAIQSENDGEVDEDESMEDDDDDEDHPVERSEIKNKGKGGAKPKSVSHKKGANNASAATSGANRKRKADEPLPRSQAKKEKTAVSTKGKTTKVTKKRSEVGGASLESLATASMLVDLHSGGAGGKMSANGGETKKIKKPKTSNGPLMTPSTMSGVSKAKAKVQQSAGTSSSSSSGNAGSSDDSRKHCEACGAEETPCWRPGYDANSVLCNSCGLRYKKSGVYCTAIGCKYIPLKAEFAAMEEDRKKNGREHLQCFQCRQPVAPPSSPPTSAAAAAATSS